MITLGYEVWGRFLLADDNRVVIVRTVVTPRLTLAGVADLSSQNEVKDIVTINEAGMYTSQMKNPIGLSRYNLTMNWEKLLFSP